MSRARKVHVQLSLITKLDKNGQRRGGKRKGAGRPKKGQRASERHAVVERSLRARLDDRPVGHRIGERYAELDHVRASGFHAAQ